MREKKANQIEDHAFCGKEAIFLFNYPPKFQHRGDLSRVRKGAAIWLFRDFMKRPALAVIKAGLPYCIMMPKCMRAPLSRTLES